MRTATPTVDDWLHMSEGEIAALVSPRRLTVLLSIDGTRRHYLINTGKTQIENFDEYTRFSAEMHVRVYGMLFRMGVHTILSPILYPPNFLRGDHYLAQAVAGCEYLMKGSFLDLYRSMKVEARMYGDYDIAPPAARVRDKLAQLATGLEQQLPNGGLHRLMYGFNAGTFAEEIAYRGARLLHEEGQVISNDSLRQACFPYGPDMVNILIGAGAFRIGSILHPVLDDGHTDLYNLKHLALDLQANTARLILYDHLYRRWASVEDNAEYTNTDLAQLALYYRDHAGEVVGLGRLVGPGIWYAVDTSGF